MHLKNIKPSPAANPLVNRCIECGFCESNCPSRDVTITPRQRIAVYKELYRLDNLPGKSAEQLERQAEMAKIFAYDGVDTCAADGMCQEKCPVKINTGDLIKELRATEMKASPNSSGIAMVRGGAGARGGRLPLLGPGSTAAVRRK